MGGKRLFFFSFHLISFKEKGKKKNAELTHIKKKKDRNSVSCKVAIRFDTAVKQKCQVQV